MKKASFALVPFLILILAGCMALPASQTSSTSSTQSNASAAAALPSGSVQQAQYQPTITVNSAVFAQIQTTFQEIYQNVNPSVVNIQTVQSVGRSLVTGEGSGFVWDLQGHIVTNNHVVDGASQITVVFATGDALTAKVIGTDPASDLAVIQVDASKAALRPVAIGDSSLVQVGDLVIAIGNPYGLSGTMTQGIVSALSRSLTVDASNPFSSSSYTIPDIIQTDAAINPGNSGGVLVNGNSEVIGVTSAIQSNTNSNSGVGFVIPAKIVQKVVPVLISKGSYAHPSLGLTGTTLTPVVASEVGLDTTLQGVLVVDLTPGGPADKAGIISSSQQMARPGLVTVTAGDVITAVDGRSLKTYEDLVSYLFNSTEVGQKVALTILRDGKQQTVNVTLGSN
ncbi:MAG: trypsin-like peptidase domain-containing protein [Anaerolineaceae bacterium]